MSLPVKSITAAALKAALHDQAGTRIHRDKFA